MPDCLESIKPVADEIILVDTGSTDKSCAVAERFGAKIFHFGWQDDFAAARNFSLTQATGNWILVLDADEVISKSDYTTLQQLTSVPAPEPTAYQLLTRNYINLNNIVGWRANDSKYPEEEQGCGWMPSLKTRLWSNDPKIRFSYPVHELVEPSLEKIGISAKTCPVVIHHYGKLDYQKAQAKGEGYFLLGLQKLEEMEDAIIPLRELAVQAGVLKRHQDAIDLWQRFLKLAPNNAEAHLNLGTALFTTGEIKKALTSAKKAAQFNQNLKESHFNISLYELHLGRTAAAAKRLKQLLQRVPEYPAAHFLHAATVCCRDGIKKGQSAFQEIKNNFLTKDVMVIAGEELANTLTKAGQSKSAAKIKKAISNLSST